MELYVIYTTLLVILVQVSRLTVIIADLKRIRKITNELYWELVQRDKQ